ncbi:MAG: SEC-C metal-binding domain-containing protein [Vicinamibacterales bacterium]
MAKTGRNDLCHCGSGKKYKKCHGVRETPAARGRVMLFIVGGAVVAAILVGIVSFSGQRASGPTRVWSTEHGHYHDANGVAVP